MTMTMKQVKAIQANQMIDYIKTKEQAERWYHLTKDKFPVYRKDGTVLHSRKKTFESARLAFFSEFYLITPNEPRSFEREAEEIYQMFQ